MYIITHIRIYLYAYYAHVLVNVYLSGTVPGICRALNTMGYTNYQKKAIILVICPLNVLIESHMKELRQRSILCTCLSGTTPTKLAVTMMITPSFLPTLEALVLNEKGRKMIQMPVYQTNLFGIVTDETHVLVIPK